MSAGAGWMAWGVAWFRARVRIEAEDWRERLLGLILRFGVVLGTLLYVPGVWMAWRAGVVSIVVIDTLALGVTYVLAFGARGRFRARAGAFVAICTLLGVSLLVEVGAIGQSYLLASSLIATMLLKLRVGLVSVLVNATALLVVGAAGAMAGDVMVRGGEDGTVSWVVVTLNFAFVNVLLVLCAGAIIEVLEATMQGERQARVRLEFESHELVRANAAVRAEIVERQRAEQEREKLEEELRQAHKMEAIGRLAGGVAHDFNNMLTVILGNVSLLRLTGGHAEATLTGFDEIQRAAERAADLTRQLLAFARKQRIAPRALQLDATVTDMLKLLRRLIGEQVELGWRPGAGAGTTVFLDPAQLDQVLVNLVINARQAITASGRIIIATRRTEIEPEERASELACPPGAYVIIEVSDDGCGMDAATRARIFEPFFTTKALGEGTGLGLATVYGIVQQNGGAIHVYSEPGQGSTFRIYLPVAGAGAAPAAPVVEASEGAATGARPSGAGRTVMVVEDEDTVLELVRRLLEQLGHTVLAVGDPREAVRLAAEHPGVIDALITDVVMPHMSGREVHEAVRARRPEIRCLYMSGYAAELLGPAGGLGPGVGYLQKPFNRREFVAKLAEVWE